MADTARKLAMTVAEFLDWDDGTDTRYQLVGGEPVAMAPSASFHNRIASNAVVTIDRRVGARPPCRAESQAGVTLDDRSFYVADVAATCAPGGNTPHVVEPFLIVEVLSPSTRAFDLQSKVQRYSRLGSVQEIWLVESERRWVQHWSRSGDAWIVRMLDGDMQFDSPALGDRIGLDELYRNVDLEPAATEAVR